MPLTLMQVNVSQVSSALLVNTKSFGEYFFHLKFVRFLATMKQGLNKKTMHAVEKSSGSEGTGRPHVRNVSNL